MIEQSNIGEASLRLAPIAGTAYAHGAILASDRRLSAGSPLVRLKQVASGIGSGCYAWFEIDNA